MQITQTKNILLIIKTSKKIKINLLLLVKIMTTVINIVEMKILEKEIITLIIILIIKSQN